VTTVAALRSVSKMSSLRKRARSATPAFAALSVLSLMR
jgi:hypothetical protein